MSKFNGKFRSVFFNNVKLDLNERLIQKAFYLSLFTIVYNLVEGSISVFFGLEDETLALLGFGVDSFVEVISGLGIAHMILRMKRNPVSSRDAFERTALKITGIAFYILTIGLLAGAVLNVIYQTEPETTLPGIIVSSISIATMYYLMKSKLKVGKELNSDAIIADANCTKTCFNLSIILLGASLFYELTGIAYFDVIGSLGIAYFAFKEGKESFEKSNSNSLACSCDH